MIEPAFESIIYATIHQKAERFKSTIYAVNGVQDHIYVAASIPPSIAVAKWVGEMKGASARAVNTAFESQETRFRWQSGYGVLTFGVLNLEYVIDYINRHKEHHRQQTTNQRLEEIDD